jgi:hypothetical protein
MFILLAFEAPMARRMQSRIKYFKNELLDNIEEGDEVDETRRDIDIYLG